MPEEILVEEAPIEEILVEKPVEITSISVFSAAEMIKDVERKYFITSILIDTDAQTCTVKRKSVLSWGEANCCTSTSYDEVILTGKEFVTVVSGSYDTLSAGLYAYMTERGI